MTDALISILVAYFLCSISSSHIVGLFFGNGDIKNERDGRVSAATVYDKMGKFPFLLAVCMDIGLAALAVSIARMLNGSINVMMLAGFAAVCGHNWSIWLKFKGGQGATTIAGVLLVVVPWQFFYALVVGAILYMLTRRSNMSTAVTLLCTSAFIIVQIGFGVLSAFPLLLFTLMLLKRYQAFREPKAAG